MKQIPREPLSPRRVQKIMRTTAIHEAGHAMAHWYSGTMFDVVVIRTPDEYFAGPYIDGKGREVDCLGLVEAGARHNPWSWLSDSATLAESMKSSLAERGILPLARRSAEIEMFISYAGPMAEAKGTRLSVGTAFLFGGEGDIKKADACAKDFANDKAENSAMHRVTERRVRRMLRDPRIWQATVELAARLETARSLEWEEVSELVERSTGYPEREYGHLLPPSDGEEETPEAATWRADERWLKHCIARYRGHEAEMAALAAARPKPRRSRKKAGGN